MASPWGKIEKVDSVNFAEIMSEQYANDLHDKELKKQANHLPDDSSSKPKEPGVGPIVDIIPEEVLKAIQEEDAAFAADAFGEDTCGSDEVLARLLQSQFDHEYNEELKRIENQRNKDSKVRISLENYRRDVEAVEPYDEAYYDEGYNQPKSNDWDRFETNEKKFDGIPKRGFKLVENGEKITKHDPDICGVRNACRMMSFPPEFPTGDGAGFDMKLPNSVFNKLKSTSHKAKKAGRMYDRKEARSTCEMAVDMRTKLILYKLVNNQVLEQVNGIISTGKEALILHADGDPSYEGDSAVPKECAVKIFKTTMNEFKQRDRYIKDDYRFEKRFSKQNKQIVINMWAEKEMLNLKRMQKCGINCPSVVMLKKYILVMSFIGENHNAAPKLKDVRLSDAELSTAYEEIVQVMHKLYNEAKLVHGDLSEYNILWQDGQCVFIDVAQAVEPDHPGALEFLMRDCGNIITFFSRRGLPNIYTKEELFEHITGLNAEDYNATMLEKIHAKGASEFMSTANNQDAMLEDFKPVSYSFDLAWEKSIKDKEEKMKSAAAAVETADALQVLSLKLPQEVAE